MSKMWRPDSWDAQDIYAEYENVTNETNPFWQIEAGADAMLKAVIVLMESNTTYEEIAWPDMYKTLSGKEDEW